MPQTFSAEAEFPVSIISETRECTLNNIRKEMNNPPNSWHVAARVAD